MFLFIYSLSCLPKYEDFCGRRVSLSIFFFFLQKNHFGICAPRERIMQKPVIPTYSLMSVEHVLHFLLSLKITYKAEDSFVTYFFSLLGRKKEKEKLRDYNFSNNRSIKYFLGGKMNICRGRERLSGRAMTNAMAGVIPIALHTSLHLRLSMLTRRSISEHGLVEEKIV